MQDTQTKQQGIDEMIAMQSGLSNAFVHMDYSVWRAALSQDLTPENLAKVGEAFIEKGQIAEGIKLVLEVVAQNPDDFVLTMAAAILVLHRTLRYDIAVALLRKATLLRPDIYHARLMLADALLVKNDVNEACEQFATALKLFPEHKKEINQNLIVYFIDCGYPKEALDIAYTVLGEEGPTPLLLNDVACAIQRLNQSETALSIYAQSLQLDPECETSKFGYAATQLKCGKYAEGFVNYAGRPLKITPTTEALAALPRVMPGQDVAGKKIICYQEQGIGDTLNFARFATVMRGRGAEVALAVPPTLLRLFELSFAGIKCFSTLEDVPLDNYDYGSPIPDLPGLARVKTAQDLLVANSYLKADPADVAKFAVKLPARWPRIGLIWAGECRGNIVDYLADRRRSILLEKLMAALGPVEATLVSLQLGPPREELAECTDQPIFDPMDDVHDMADTAAIMENLDLILSVDTSTAHLAGALARPVWMISRWDACWRWGDAGETTPWYPTMRIFRSQERAFEPVLAEVGGALRAWCKNWQPT